MVSTLDFRYRELNFKPSPFPYVFFSRTRHVIHTVSFHQGVQMSFSKLLGKPGKMLLVYRIYSNKRLPQINATLK